MGLDCYVYRKTFIPAPKEGTTNLTIEHKTWLGQDFKRTFKDVTYIVEQIGYWRKANQIHAYFVDKCGDGVDECQEIPVNRKDLEELLEICKQILKRKRWKSFAEEHLPSRGGFFFGTTEYDEWYLQDIKHTVEVLENALAEPDDGRVQYIYQASW